MNIRSKEEFKTLISSKDRTIVKFYTNWCPDCKRMDAFMPSVIEEVGSLTIHELNKDELPEVSEEQDVMGIPSLLVFQNGQKMAHLHSANAKTPGEVIKFLNTHFK
ncbi:thioredoxin family protein [Bacillus salacetis]|uniref:thioredoxin family protein n=1 Tax=Bacillus salacetis TaxID=2315464 RepID=UPI003BA26CBD